VRSENAGGHEPRLKLTHEGGSNTDEPMSGMMGELVDACGGEAGVRAKARSTKGTPSLRKERSATVEKPSYLR